MVVFMLRDQNIFFATAVGGLTYLALVWTLPILTNDEHRKILSLVGRVSRKLRPASLQG